MDIGKALTFFTEDERWIEKAAIGVGLILVSMLLSAVLIGVVGYLILAGYTVRLLQNVRDGVEKPLPDWDQWGEDLLRGFKLAVVGIVWALPIIVFTIPIMIGGAMTDGARGGAGEFIGSMILICGSCLIFLYSLVVALATPGFTIAFAEDENIRSGLAFTDILRWTQDNIGQVLLVAVVYVVGQLIISLAGVLSGLILCIIGLVVTVPLSIVAAYVFQYHLFGQLAAIYPMNGGMTMAPAVTLPPTAPDADPDDPFGPQM